MSGHAACLSVGQCLWRIRAQAYCGCANRNTAGLLNDLWQSSRCKHSVDGQWRRLKVESTPDQTDEIIWSCRTVECAYYYWDGRAVGCCQAHIDAAEWPVLLDL